MNKPLFNPEAIYRGDGKAIFKITRIVKGDYYATGYSYLGKWREDSELGFIENIPFLTIVEDKDVIEKFLNKFNHA